MWLLNHNKFFSSDTIIRPRAATPIQETDARTERMLIDAGIMTGRKLSGVTYTEPVSR